ncbi:MAG: putative PHD type zinc finger protein with BAH domain-containing protein [Phylliscum demangeonii]|nr:MAG: putative PHD type zinc finger protein with BAH domain-containing protein [Phylliscum demangeonii]
MKAEKAARRKDRTKSAVGRSSRRVSTAAAGSATHRTSATPTAQPMTATTSASSSSARSALNGTTATSSYGTRSRLRAGASRPNYAEDADIEMDDDLGRAVRPEEKKPKSAPVTEKKSARTTPTEHVATGVKTRRSSAALDHALNGKNAPAPTIAPQSIPRTSTFSANPDVDGPPAKRRKLTAGEKASGRQSSTAPAPAPAATSTRKSSSAVAPTPRPRETNMLTFERSKGYLKDGKLKADDGTVLQANDHVYLVCEPPSEPYYLARIMEFIHSEHQPNLPVDSIRVNWYYRPRDISRKTTDTRLIFATMHSDMCPLTSLRGKCRILHRSEIDDLDEYRKRKDCFWYEKLFDRYIHWYYDVIPVGQVINVPGHVKKVLDEHWKFLLVETGRGKELISAVKTCKRCGGYCASNDSVQCAVCQSTYHMNCVRPALLKKPSRGFAWACAPCSRAQERKLEARNVPMIKDIMEQDEEEIFEEDEEDPTSQSLAGPDAARPKQQAAAVDLKTPEQSAHASLWPYRYLGQHCRVEDALDSDDRIYPRAASRLGPRHQAMVLPWPGRAVEYVKPIDVKRKYTKSTNAKKDGKSHKEATGSAEADRVARENRPKWVLDEPTNYLPRGDDHENDDAGCTAQLLFKMPDASTASASAANKPSAKVDSKTFGRSQAADEKLLDAYIKKAKSRAEKLGVNPLSTNLLDKALEALCKHRYDARAARKSLKTMVKQKDLHEPNLTKDEQKRFEEGVAKFGSELHSVAKHVRTAKHGDIVRYYYVWKKTDRGQQIWGNYAGRRGKKEARRIDGSKLVDDVADDYDDSAYDEEKAKKRKRGFACKFCGIRASTQWRRAPGVPPGTIITLEGSSRSNARDKGGQFLIALCQRCAELWRRYGIQWEDLDDVAKKAAQSGGKAWKRKIDEELLKELGANRQASAGSSASSPPAATTSAAANPAGSVPAQAGPEPAKKKRKVSSEKATSPPSMKESAAATLVPDKAKKAVADKKSPKPRPTSVPVVPEIPKAKVMPCAICNQVSPRRDQHLSCKECRLTVHRDCYGVMAEVRNASKWMCDMCANDKNPQISTSYQCVLCPVRSTDHDFVDGPKPSTKKRSEKEKETIRRNRESAVAAAEFYRRKQEECNRPVNPREPLKRTAGNNWVHVTCAVWTPETKFGKARALEPSEGIGMIPAARYEQICKVCKTSDGACVPCHQCHAPVHVACAQKAGYRLGFDIAPIKSSRRELVNTVTLGQESGLMTAALWCPEHPVKTIIYPISEVAEDSGLNAIQLYVRNYKQADLTLTGTVRKANLVSQSTKAVAQSHGGAGLHRRTSTSNGINGNVSASPNHPLLQNGFKAGDAHDASVVSAPKDSELGSNKEECSRCFITVSPKWWDIVCFDSATIVLARPGPEPVKPCALPDGYPAADENQYRPIFGGKHSTSTGDQFQSWFVRSSDDFPAAIRYLSAVLKDGHRTAFLCHCCRVLVIQQIESQHGSGCGSDAHRALPSRELLPLSSAEKWPQPASNGYEPSPRPSTTAPTPPNGSETEMASAAPAISGSESSTPERRRSRHALAAMDRLTTTTDDGEPGQGRLASFLRSLGSVEVVAGPGAAAAATARDAVGARQPAPASEILFGIPPPPPTNLPPGPRQPDLAPGRGSPPSRSHHTTTATNSHANVDRDRTALPTASSAASPLTSSVPAVPSRPSALDTRPMGGGASASPSLRNLLS